MALLRALGAKATEWRRRPMPTSKTPFGSPDVVVLRTNPRDSSLARVITVLVEEYRTLALVWDRTNSYRCPVQSPRLLVKRSTRAGAYFRLSTVLKVMALQPWFLTSTLRARPKVVHAMDLDTGIIGLLAARLLRVPFVYQCLDPYAASLPVEWPRVIARLVDRIENAVISRAALFIITDLRRLPQHQRASPKAVVELPNIPMWRAEPQPPSTSGLVVGYIGSLWPHRSLDTIIHTVGGLSDEGISLVVGGFGPLEDDVRRWTSMYPNVAFLGWVPDDEIVATIARFDVFVQIEDPDHASYRWVSPNKVFESMALSRPIIVAERTLAAERATEAGHGITVRYEDAEDLRNVLLNLSRDRSLILTLGAAGQLTFQAHWSPESVTRTVLDEYRRIVRTGSR